MLGLAGPNPQTLKQFNQITILFYFKKCLAQSQSKCLLLFSFSFISAVEIAVLFFTGAKHIIWSSHRPDRADDRVFEPRQGTAHWETEAATSWE
jgi:hypothetical protein